MSEMNDPPRLLDTQAGAPEALRDLFRRGERDLPSDATLERLAARLGPVLAAPAAPPANAGLNPWLVRGLGIAFGVAAVGLVTLSVTRRDPSPESAPREVAPPAVTAPAPVIQPPVAVPSAEIAPAPVVEATPAASAAVDAPASQKRAQPSEAALLEQARRALTADPARALSLTRQHQQRFPKGILSQEREVIAIEALRRLGKANEAGDRAGAFEKQFPGSAHQRSVESRGGK